MKAHLAVLVPLAALYMADPAHNRLSRYRFEQKHSPAMACLKSGRVVGRAHAMSVAWAHCHREQHKVRHAVASGIWSWLAKRSFPCDASACTHFIH